MINVLTTLPFSIMFVMIVCPAIKSFFKKRELQYRQLDYVTFYKEDWLFEQKATKLTKQDEKELETQLQLEINNLPDDSVLEYILNKRGNKQRENESKKEFVVRLIKTDFEKNHGLQIDEFINICNDIHKNNPEMLI